MKNVPSCKQEGQRPATSISPALSRRKFMHLAGMAAAGVALDACAPFQPKQASQSGDKVQLVYQDWRTDWFPSMAATPVAVTSGGATSAPMLTPTPGCTMPTTTRPTDTAVSVVVR